MRHSTYERGLHYGEYPVSITEMAEAIEANERYERYMAYWERCAHGKGVNKDHVDDNTGKRPTHVSQ